MVHPPPQRVFLFAILSGSLSPASFPVILLAPALHSDSLVRRRRHLRRRRMWRRCLLEPWRCIVCCTLRLSPRSASIVTPGNLLSSYRFFTCYAHGVFKRTDSIVPGLSLSFCFCYPRWLRFVGICCIDRTCTIRSSHRSAFTLGQYCFRGCRCPSGSAIHVGFILYPTSRIVVC